ncbi:MAG TPA: sialidase family protein [Candidatus Limnocylindrales bacterium]|nr:sialidase family protein [Candidatus Limnocylindrales bacterium]
MSRSADTGQTWSAATVLGGGLRPAIATDGLGTWGIFSDGGGTQVQLDRSVDGGLTWLPRQRLDFDDVNNVYSDFFIDAATDGTGNWVACWRRGGTVVATRSADNGQTWSSPVFVGSAGFGSPLGLAMTTDAHGSWVIAWGLQAAPVVDEETGIHVARSIDNGATWSAPQLLAATFASDHGYEEDVGLEVGPDGAFYASWHTSFGTTGQDPDVFFSRSLDGGQTWTTPSAVNVGATRDGSASDALATVGYGGNGAWIGVWASDNSLNGTVGDDRDIFFARGQEDCPPSPSPSCLSPTLPGRSRLMLKDGPGGTDKLVWKWTAGQATTTEDLGDPTTGTSYAFCIYDRPADTVRVVFEADAGAGLACTDGPCWIAAGDGFAYRDSALSNGSIRSLSLTPGSDGRAKIQLRAAGAALGPPRMPLVKAPNIIAQLVNTETGKCWEATFSSATLNDSSRFKARSD